MQLQLLKNNYFQKNSITTRIQNSPFQQYTIKKTVSN